MFVVKNRKDSNSVVSRHFTEWEAQEVADAGNEAFPTEEYYVEEK